MASQRWGRATIAPRGGPPPKHDIRFPCPGISRFLGLAAFFVVANVVYYAGSSYLQLAPLDASAAAWTGEHMVLVGVTLIAALIAGIMGSGAGLLIEVRNEMLNNFFIVLFQFASLNAVQWPVTVGVMMTATVGKEASMAAVLRHGIERATTEMILIGVLLGLWIGLIWFLMAWGKINRLFYFLLAVGPALLTARWNFQTYGIDGNLWTVAGLATTLLLPIVCRGGIERDRRQRQLLLEMAGEVGASQRK